MSAPGFPHSLSYFGIEVPSSVLSILTTPFFEVIVKRQHESEHLEDKRRRFTCLLTCLVGNNMSFDYGPHCVDLVTNQLLKRQISEKHLMPVT